jgi:hypothetical protein
VTRSTVPSVRWKDIVTLVAPFGVAASAKPRGGCGTFGNGAVGPAPQSHVTLAIFPCVHVAVVSPPSVHVTVYEGVDSALALPADKARTRSAAAAVSRRLVISLLDWIALTSM